MRPPSALPASPELSAEGEAKQSMKFRYQRYMIRTALVYLFVGISLGIVLYLTPLFPEIAKYRLRTVHVHLILMGSVIQLIMGVALWIFPRKKESPNYTSEREGLTLYLIFNAGTLLRSFCDVQASMIDIYYYFALVGILLQICGLGYFVVLILPRIRVPGGA